MKSLLLLFSICAITLPAFTQNYFEQQVGPPVFYNGKQLKYPWAGGLNNPQFAAADLDGDGVDDLVVLNRGSINDGSTVITFLNGGTQNQVDYTYAPGYAKTLPNMRHWMLSMDYDCDGTPDFVTWSEPGLMVLYRGVRNTNGLLEFPTQDTLWFTSGTGTKTNIYVAPTDYPGMADLNGDGDIDVMTFDLGGARLDYFENLSVETNNGCGDTTGFDIKSYCWGDIEEDGLSRTLFLNRPCLTPKTDDQIETGGARHVGSTIMIFDENGDGLKDVILGDITFNNVTRLSNNGTPDSAVVTAQDTTFPSYGRPVNIPVFPVCSYVDVDNDGRKDLIAGPNSPKKGFNHNCAWYYKDISTNNAVNFQFQTDSFMVGDMIDVGEGAYPAFVDVNGDGLLDMVVGNNGYYENTTNQIAGLALFINVGSTYSPAFNLVDKDYLGLSTFISGAIKINAIAPAFGDLNGDGATDMIIGDQAGNLHFFRNTAAAGDSMRLVLQEAQYKGIDIGTFARPEIYDVNGDGLQDLIVGRITGTLHYFENTGTSSIPDFSPVPSNGFFGEVNVKPFLPTGESAPRVVNITHTGQAYLLVGNILGNVALFELDPAKRYNGVFNQVNPIFSGIDIGEYSNVAIADIDNDGKLELAVGSLRGGLQFYKETNSTGLLNLSAPAELSVRAFPNPSAGSWNLSIADAQVGEVINIEVYDVLGKLIHQERQFANSNQVQLPVLLPVEAGIYICKVQQGQRSTMVRLLAQ